MKSIIFLKILACLNMPEYIVMHGHSKQSDWSDFCWTSFMLRLGSTRTYMHTHVAMPCTFSQHVRYYLLS